MRTRRADQPYSVGNATGPVIPKEYARHRMDLHLPASARYAKALDIGPKIVRAMEAASIRLRASAKEEKEARAEEKGYRASRMHGGRTIQMVGDSSSRGKRKPQEQRH